MNYPALSSSYVVAPAHNSRAHLAYQVPGGEAYPVTAMKPPLRPDLLPVPLHTWDPIEPPRRQPRWGAVALLILVTTAFYFYLLFSI